MRQRHGFSLIELMVSSAVTFLTVLTVSAAFLNYSQSFYTQAGIRGGQASLRQSHLMVIRHLRMAGYGMEPYLAFGFPDKWMRDDANQNNRSNRLVFRMRNVEFNAFAGSVSSSAITLNAPLRETLRQGQIIQVVCEGGAAVTYAQLSADAPASSTTLSLAAAASTPVFPRMNNFDPFCFSLAGSERRVNVFKIDVYDYSVRFIEDRPYLFRSHGLGSSTAIDPYGEPVAEDIEAFRVTFFRERVSPLPTVEGSPFIPDPTEPPPLYDTPMNDPRRWNYSPGNIRAVSVAMVARSSTRDLATTSASVIPSFSKREDLLDSKLAPKTGALPQTFDLEAPITKDHLNAKTLPTGVRRVVSEMTVQIRNMLSSEMPVPLYESPARCMPGPKTSPLDFNCAGG